MSGIPRNKTAAAKAICLVVILLLSMQYFINTVVYNRNHSAFLTVISYAVETGNRSASDFIRHFMTQTTAQPMESCPLIPPDIRGRIPVNLQVPAWAYVEEQNQMLSPGGRYKPEGCVARHRVAVIIPYRDREIHLKIFLQNIHPFLRSQQLDYGIFVVEMAPNARFNRAALLNIGFLEASKLYDFQCFIFHDVDLLPEDDRNLYVCPSMPRHMSVAIDKLKYKLPYPQIFGGVSAISKNHFVKINGFSNLYFGWGGEDDDMYKRILYSNLTVIRYSTEVARYKMLSHVKDKGNPQRYSLLRSTRARRLFDGINSLKYTRLKLEFRPLYTWIYVTANETEIMNNKIVKAKIDAVQAMLAKMAKDKAKVDQAKNKLQGKTVQNQKPGQTNPAQNRKPKPTPSVGKEAMAQIKHAQIQGIIQATKAQNGVVQSENQKPVKPKAPPSQKPATQAKPVPKPVPGAFPKPQFVSWVPTNASVPERLTIDERLRSGPIHMKLPKRIMNAKDVA